MKRKFTGTGDWPSPQDGARVTNADILAFQRECPEAFERELAGTALALHAHQLAVECAGFVVTPDMTPDEIRVGAFKALSNLGVMFFGESVPAPEVTDE